MDLFYSEPRLAPVHCSTPVCINCTSYSARHRQKGGQYELIRLVIAANKGSFLTNEDFSYCNLNLVASLFNYSVYCLAAI